jgi:hypothetical protein
MFHKDQITFTHSVLTYVESLNCHFSKKQKALFTVERSLQTELLVSVTAAIKLFYTNCWSQ